jgi:phosphopantothenoylcysteine decarboxylase / phosphopantothenate---cysteine ligase
MSQILLGCAASAALHKACDLASKLTQAGHRVRAVLTPRAAQLIAPQLFEALTGEPASVDEFHAQRHAAMDHIDLAKWAEVVLIAPASADLIGRLAHGIATDLLVTAVLATAPKTPKFLCPAMNPNMLEQPAVQRNLAQLSADGWTVVEPGVGHMACGDGGKGRLPEPADIVALLKRALA